MIKLTFCPQFESRACQQWRPALIKLQFEKLVGVLWNWIISLKCSCYVALKHQSNQISSTFVCGTKRTLWVWQWWVSCAFIENKKLSKRNACIYLFFILLKNYSKSLIKKIQTMSENANKIYGESKNFWKKVNVASYIFFLRLIGLWQSSSSPSIDHLNYLIFIITILYFIPSALKTIFNTL